MRSEEAKAGRVGFLLRPMKPRQVWSGHPLMSVNATAAVVTWLREYVGFPLELVGDERNFGCTMFQVAACYTTFRLQQRRSIAAATRVSVAGSGMTLTASDVPIPNEKSIAG
jgi:hypothetical protein